MTIIETLVEKFPIRKNKAQKQAFHAWFIEEAAAMGYTAQAEKKGSNTNLIAGDPETAKVIYTAHYDTPAVMPIPNFLTPKNIPFYILYQLLITLIMILLVGGIAGLVGWLTKNFELAYAISMLFLFVLLFLMLCGPANKNNVNDNTSGVAAVMEIMSRLPESSRQNAAFILFDNEEKGMLGSSAYASKHKNIKKNSLLINLDCVGDGENILFFVNKKTRALPAYAKLEEVLKAQPGRNLMLEKMEKCVYPSDQALFKYGIAVCACNKMKVLGYYVDKIHTKKDLVCDQANMDFLGESLAKFAVELGE